MGAGEKAAFALREAKLLADSLGDPEGAIRRYLWVLDEVDPKNRDAMKRVAELEEKRENNAGLAAILERELPVTEPVEDQLVIARRLADLYQGTLADDAKAIAALEVVYRLDGEDFDALARLADLSEKTENWPRLAVLLSALIEIEGDEDELSNLTRKLAGLSGRRARPGR